MWSVKNTIKVGKEVYLQCTFIAYVFNLKPWVDLITWLKMVCANTQQQIRPATNPSMLRIFILLKNITELREYLDQALLKQTNHEFVNVRYHQITINTSIFGDLHRIVLIWFKLWAVSIALEAFANCRFSRPQLKKNSKKAHLKKRRFLFSSNAPFP